MEFHGAYQVSIDRESDRSGFRAALDPTETVTSDWIAEMDTAIDVLEAHSAD